MATTQPPPAASAGAPQTPLLLVYEDTLRFAAYAGGMWALQLAATGDAPLKDKLQMVAAGAAGSALYHYVLKDHLSVLYATKPQPRAP